jgi:hypothetical protein
MGIEREKESQSRQLYRRPMMLAIRSQAATPALHTFSVVPPVLLMANAAATAIY